MVLMLHRPGNPVSREGPPICKDTPSGALALLPGLLLPQPEPSHQLSICGDWVRGRAPGPAQSSLGDTNAPGLLWLSALLFWGVFSQQQISACFKKVNNFQ